MDDWLVWKYFGLTAGFAGAPASPAAPAKPTLPASIERRVSSLVIGILLLNIARSEFSIPLDMQADHTKISIFLADHEIIHPIAEIDQARLAPVPIPVKAAMALLQLSGWGHMRPMA